MASRFTVSREDQLKSKTVTPGWYQAIIKEVEQKPAKTDGSNNTFVTFVIQGSVFDGVPVDRVFSEKAPGFAVPFIEAVMGRKMKPEGEEVDLEMAKGKKIKIYVKNDMYQGRAVNKAEDFAAI